METKSEQIINSTKRIVELLKMSDTPDARYYCDFLIYILGELNKPHELYKIAKNVLSIYGGMGTFGDVAIFKNGQYLIEEFDEFYELRTKLFLLCKEVIEQAREAE